MPVINTRNLFEEMPNRIEKTGQFVAEIFPKVPPEAICYELERQGLLNHGDCLLPFDAWAAVEQELLRLQQLWNGPDVAIYLLPIQNGYVKNGICYENGIFLFLSRRITLKELHALLAHEYHHSCRRQFVNEPATLLDSVLLEGLAEYAVGQLYGEHALSSWTKRYSLEEVKSIWHKHFLPALAVVGIQQHERYLFGDQQQLPPWIGYCTGYRIVEEFIRQQGNVNSKKLLTIPAYDIAKGAGFL